MLIGRKKQMIDPRKNFTVRLSDLERERIMQAAKENGLTPSEYFRGLVLHGGKVDTTLMLDRRDLVNQISKIGNNLNQIAHVANASQTVSEYKIMQIKDYMKDIYNLLMEVLNKWQ